MDEPLGTFERAGEHVDLRFERHYPRAIETVWAALTDPARLADWMSPADVEPLLGGRFVLFTDRAEPMAGRILVWAPPCTLEISWSNQDAPDSVVRFDLATDGAGTLLVFTQRRVRFVCSGLMLPGWHVYFERLRRLLDGAPEKLSGPRWRALQAIYFDRCDLAGALRDPPAAGS